MKILNAAGFAVAGGIAGVIITIGLQAFSRPSLVHAQDQFTTVAGCVSAIPKGWGNLVGASTYGLAFQDDKGTLRFIQQPLCGNAVSISNAPTPSIDLELVRK